MAFLLAAAGVLANGWRGSHLDRGAITIAGLAAGLAIGSKLTLLPPVAVLFVGVLVLAKGSRRFAVVSWTACVLATGGFWYLRNIAYAGNPFPWIRLGVGPLTLAQADSDPAAGYRFSILHYAINSRVWHDYFLPGLRDGFGPLWPLVLALAVTGVVLALIRGSAIQRVLALAATASAFAYVVNPLSAPGPDGAPTQFATNLRYLAPALALGLVLLPTTLPTRLRSTRWLFPALAAVLVFSGARPDLSGLNRDRMGSLLAGPHMDDAYRWAAGVSGARIATTSVLQYGLTGQGLSNRVAYVGIPGPNGTFVDPTTCRQWREAIDAGRFDFLVLAPLYEGASPPVPIAWASSRNAHPILRSAPTTVFRLSGPLSPAECPPHVATLIAASGDRGG
jgi:hypothetical protein